MLLLVLGTALARDNDFGIEHDDHGTHEPPPKGTGSALCVSGVSSGFPCRNIELLSRLPIADIGGGSGADSWGWKDAQTGRYFAIVARSNGTAFIEVSNPSAPLYLGNLPSTSGQQPWRDVKVYADHAFIVADGINGHGMQVFDLARLRDVSSPQTFDPDVLYTGIGSAHNIAINEDSGFAYIVGGDACSGGLHMVDISTPQQPRLAGCYSGDGYTHDVQCVSYDGPDSDYAGREICLASNEDSVTIVDVSSKSSPQMLSKALYPETAYSHQGWLDESMSLFFLGDEIDELSFGMNTRTLIFDVQDLDNPVFLGAHQHGTTSIDHNLYVKGDYLYQANYRSGLRILKIKRDPTVRLEEVAYFDTEPENDSLGFTGAWNVYPFFDNDTVLVSDVNNGLFVLRVALDDTADGPLNGAISGAWTAQGFNDQGLMLLVGETVSGPFVYFAWFLFLNGEPFWLTGVQAFEYGQDEVTIPTQRLSGLEFLAQTDAEATRLDIGAVNIHVHSCNELHVDYDFEGLGADELTFTRLAGVQGRACSD
ncbi:MAG: choice-of-anchor B family protein [Xanthomonadales bacterium]|nr:choice-of-anchor B family protein [Xanthomonadales bacterium]